MLLFGSFELYILLLYLFLHVHDSHCQSISQFRGTNSNGVGNSFNFNKFPFFPWQVLSITLRSTDVFTQVAVLLCLATVAAADRRPAPTYGAPQQVITQQLGQQSCHTQRQNVTVVLDTGQPVPARRNSQANERYKTHLILIHLILSGVRISRDL